MELIRTLGPMALAATLIGILPLTAGLGYAARPTELRLSMVRTLSLATVFATVSDGALGLVYGLHFIARRQPGGLTPAVAAGFADSLVPLADASGKQRGVVRSLFLGTAPKPNRYA